MSNHYIWDKVWAETKDDEHFWWWVERESNGRRGRRIISYIARYLGGINVLNIVEVGSGAGVHSLVLAKHGAKVTLIDYSEKALMLARKHFDSLGLPGFFLCANVLNLEPNLREKFDIAMSFGTVEHYRYPERLVIAKAHMDLVRPGGVVIISVPNRWFFIHEILKLFLQKRGKWHLGYEGAFTRQELLQLGNRLGLENIEIYGSAFITDMFRYLRIIQGTRFFRRFCRVYPKDISTRDLVSSFDDFLGADIFLMGCKPLSVPAK